MVAAPCAKGSCAHGLYRRVEIYHNKTYPDVGAVNVYRKPQLLHASVRGWTRTFWTGLPITTTIKNRLLVSGLQQQADCSSADSLMCPAGQGC